MKRMIKNFILKIKEYVLIFVVSIIFGLLVYNAPITHHSVLKVFDIVSTLSIKDAFGPVYNSEAFYMYRPFAFLLFKYLYQLLGLNAIIFHLIKAFILGCFGIIIYYLLLMLGQNKRISLISSLFSVIAPAVVSDIWKVPEIEVISVLFLYLTFIFFIKLNKYKKIDKKAFVYCILFLTFTITTLLLKEFVRLTLPAVLLIYIFVFQKKLNKIQIGLLSILFILVAYVSIETLPTLITNVNDPRIMPITIQFIDFNILHNSIQLIYSIFIGGTLILFLSSLLMIFKRKYDFLIAIVALALFLLTISSPVIISFSYYEMMFFSSDSLIVFIFCIILLLSLLIKFLKGNRLIKFYSLSILAVGSLSLVSMYKSPAPASIRTFVTCLPFLFYLVVDSSFDIWRNIKRNKSIFYKTILCIVFVSALIFMNYFILSYAFNGSTEIRMFTAVDYNAKEYLTTINLENKILFYTHDVHPTNDVDLRLFGSKYVNNTKFMFLDSDVPSNDINDLEKEICVKSQSNLDKNVYIYSIIQRPQINDSLYPILQGNFEWLEQNGTFRIVQPLPKTSNYFGWPWGFGVAKSYQKNTFTNETLLEKFLNKDGNLVYEYNVTYYQTPPWLEDISSRLYYGIPLLMKYESIGKIYSLNVSKLNCDNWYYLETTPDNTNFTWMSQNATLTVFNSKNQDENIKLNLTFWSFYKPRTLEIYSNEKLVGSYSTTLPQSRVQIMTPLITIKPGKNVILFHSRDGCDIPEDVVAQMKNDQRCLSFAFSDISNISVENLSKLPFVYESDWHPGEDVINDQIVKWMPEKATISIYNIENKTEQVKLIFIAKTFYKPRTLEIYSNDKLIGSYKVTNETLIISPLINLTKIENKIVFKSIEGCDVSPKISMQKNDTRCLSFVIGNLTKIEMQEDKNVSIIEHPLVKHPLVEYFPLIYASGWYDSEKTGNFTWKWIERNGTINILNPSDNTENVKINFTVWSYYKVRTLEIYHNGENLNVSSIPFDKKTNLTLNLNLSSGINTILFSSKEGCDSPNKVENSSDYRCLSLAFSKINLLR